MPPENDVPLLGQSVSHRIIALAMAAGGSVMHDEADLIPQDVWEELHNDGLLRAVFDFTGEGTSILTEDGRVVLRRAILSA